MHMRRLGLLTAAALLCHAGAALAQGATPTQAQAGAIRQACRADYQAHCASVPTGGSAALACLQQNATALSQSCQRALAAVSGGGGGAAAQTPMPQGRRGALREACAGDFRTFCSGVRPGGGRAMACLHAHGPDLSPACQAALQGLRQGR